MKNPFPHIDTFHSHGLFIPTWTVSLDAVVREEPDYEVDLAVAI